MSCLVATVCLALTGCQDDSEPAAAPSSSSTASADPSSGSPSASPSPSTSPGLDATAEEFLARLRRGMGTRGSAHMEMTVSGPAASRSSGDLRYDARGSEIRLTSRTPVLGSGELQIVVLRDAAYVSIPGLTPRGRYIRIGTDDPRFEQLAGASLQLSPEQSVKAFRAGLISVEDRGRDTVQGVATTRYEVTADSVRALQAQGGDVVPGMPETLTYQVWLDREDHMRRMGLRIRGVRLAMELSRWGEPVDIQRPPRSALVDPPAGF